MLHNAVLKPMPGMPVSAQKALIWLQELRLPFLVVTIIPMVFGTLVAWSAGVPIKIPGFLVALLGAALVHMGSNVINDYFDHRNGTDALNVEFVRGFTGGSRMIQEGRLSSGEVLGGAAVLFAGAAVITAYLTLSAGLPVLLMGCFGLAAAVSYSLFLHSLVFGELMVGFCFGTLLPAGSFFVQAGYISGEVIFASIPLALLVFLILLVNEIPDYRADRASGKKTLAVRLGRKRTAILYAATLALVYACIALIAAKIRIPNLLLSFVTLPVAIAASAYLLRHYEAAARLRPVVIATIALFTLNGMVLLMAFAARGAA